MHLTFDEYSKNFYHVLLLMIIGKFGIPELQVFYPPSGTFTHNFLQDLMVARWLIFITARCFG